MMVGTRGEVALHRGTVIMREASGQGVSQSEAFIDLSQQDRSGVGGQMSPGKIGVEFFATEAGKRQG